MHEVTLHVRKFSGIIRRQFQRRRLKRRYLLRRVPGTRKMTIEPVDGCLETQFLEMNHKIDSASASPAQAPVEELRAGDGDYSSVGMPLCLVAPVLLGAHCIQNSFQWCAAKLIGTVSHFIEGHVSMLNFGRKVSQSFMFIT